MTLVLLIALLVTWAVNFGVLFAYFEMREQRDRLRRHWPLPKPARRQADEMRQTLALVTPQMQEQRMKIERSA